MKTIFLFPVALFFLMASCSEDHKKPGYQIDMLSDMKESVAYEAYSGSPVLPNGQTLQAPPAGTIPRGGLGLQEGKGIPAATAESLQRGQFLYENYCLMCHGATGEGDGQLIPKYPNPPSFHSQRLLEMKSEDFYKVIVNGKNDMPSHAGQIQEVDRWKLVEYIKKLQGRQP